MAASGSSANHKGNRHSDAGRHDWDQWVTKYKLQYGDDGLTLQAKRRHIRHGMNTKDFLNMMFFSFLL